MRTLDFPRGYLLFSLNSILSFFSLPNRKSPYDRFQIYRQIFERFSLIFRCKKSRKFSLSLFYTADFGHFQCICLENEKFENFTKNRLPLTYLQKIPDHNENSSNVLCCLSTQCMMHRACALPV